MQNNFGLDGMLFEVETVMSNIESDDPSPFLEVTPIEGEMVGYKFLIGEFTTTGIIHENGDGELQFSVVFVDKSKEENDELLTKYIEAIKHIVNKLVEDMLSADKNENLDKNE
jgi:hypothetical protein